MILVVCAVAEELAAFAAPAHIEVVAVGVGPVDAALGTARALAAKPYDLVLSVGIGGGFRGRAGVGESVAVARETYVELGREDGAPLVLPGGIELATTAVSDERLIALYRTGVLGSHLGDGVTSATITTSDARAAQLAERFAPSVESMEGYAVLHAAARAGVPSLELRGISNLVGDRDKADWDFRAGAGAAVRALEALAAVVQVSA
jgi:futalosine hydrolase